MVRHKAVIIGAGRIGAAYQWPDDSYSHAGAYMALKDRVELVGFVEPDGERGEAAFKKWGVPWAASLNDFKDFDIVSVCTPDHTHLETLSQVLDVVQPEGVFMEKPFSLGLGKEPFSFPIQVNFLRRADPRHRDIWANGGNKRLVVYGRDDITTKCHFEDLSRWWKVPLDFRPFNGPCAYVVESNRGPHWFDNGGVDPGKCMVRMCRNLLDVLDVVSGVELWSPPY